MSKLEATFGPGRTRPAQAPDRATIRRLVDSNKPLAVHTQRWMLDALEAAEREVVAAKSVIAQHIVKTSLELSRTAGIAVDEAVRAVVALMAIDPDRRAREAEARAEAAEQAVARVRALCVTTDGEPLESDFDGNTVGDIRRALDGEQS